MNGLAVGILVAVSVTVAALLGAMIGAVITGDAHSKGREKIEGTCPACGSHEVVEFSPPPAERPASSEAS